MPWSLRSRSNESQWSECQKPPSLFGHQATNANHWTRSQHVLSWSCWSWCGSCERHVAWNVEVVDPQAPSYQRSSCLFEGCAGHSTYVAIAAPLLQVANLAGTPAHSPEKDFVAVISSCHKIPVGSMGLTPPHAVCKAITLTCRLFEIQGSPLTDKVPCTWLPSSHSNCTSQRLFFSESTAAAFHSVRWAQNGFGGRWPARSFVLSSPRCPKNCKRSSLWTKSVQRPCNKESPATVLHANTPLRYYRKRWEQCAGAALQKICWHSHLSRPMPKIYKRLEIDKESFPAKHSRRANLASMSFGSRLSWEQGLA